MTRPIWKGNISFGLISIPVTLYSAIQPQEELHFHLLDKRNKARVHYQRINDMTGKPVSWDNVVKGFEYEKGNFVIIDDEELKKSEVENFKTVEIKHFVKKQSIDPPYFDKPYYLVPDKFGEKGYALLRDILSKTDKVGIAEVVLKTKQYLAALISQDQVIELNLLRYDNELRKPAEFIEKEDPKKTKVNAAEIKMAERLVASMTTPWKPKRYHDKSKEILQSFIKNKIKRKKGIHVPKHETKTKKESAHIVDFTELLKQSVKEKKKRG